MIIAFISKPFLQILFILFAFVLGLACGYYAFFLYKKRTEQESDDKKQERETEISLNDKVRSHLNDLLNALQKLEEEKKQNMIGFEDATVASANITDIHTKVFQIRELVKNLKVLENKINNVFVEWEESGIRKEVRNKLRDLCVEGLQFSNEQINSFLDVKWCRDNLDIKYPLIRIYDQALPLDKQITDNNEHYCYWFEVFEFGDNELLFCNQWNESNIDLFTIWHESLLEQNQRTISGLTENEPEEIVVEEEREPKKIKLFGQVYEVNGWKDIILIVGEQLILKEPYKIAIYASRASTVINFDKSRINVMPKRLSNGMYVDIGCSNSVIKNYCLAMLWYCGFGYNEIKIIE